jgi:micrococcal nuclease
MTARLMASLALACSLGVALAQDRLAPSAFIVVDGDTIRSPAGIRYRLLGFDAPEIFHAQCDSEYSLGMRAKARLEDLIAGGNARLVESGKLDRYARALAVLTINGRDVAETLVQEGLARRYFGRRRQSWCDAAVNSPKRLSPTSQK